MIRHAQRPLLIPFSIVFGLVVKLRNFLFDKGILKSVCFDIPVISVGNITVGGTGKTPHVEYLVGMLKDEYQLAILSRGYKRNTRDFILSDNETAVEEIGDEPKQIKTKYPNIHVAVDRNRINGIHTLRKLIPDLKLVILDDAFQHRRVIPGLSIVLIDYTRPSFNDMMLPAGNLREPLSCLQRANIIIVTKCPDQITDEIRTRYVSRLNLKSTQYIFFSSFKYGLIRPVFNHSGNSFYPAGSENLSETKKKIFLVTGIANPHPLRQYLSSVTTISAEIVFPDHHHFKYNDFQLILKRLKSNNNDKNIVLVTEKDAIRLRESRIPEQLRSVLYYIPVEVGFSAEDELSFSTLIHQYLNRATGK